MPGNDVAALEQADNLARRQRPTKDLEFVHDRVILQSRRWGRRGPKCVLGDEEPVLDRRRIAGPIRCPGLAPIDIADLLPLAPRQREKHPIVQRWQLAIEIAASAGGGIRVIGILVANKLDATV